MAEADCCREFKGKDGRNESYRVDPGLMALLGEIRAHERQAAEELGQWIENREDSMTVNIAERLIAGRRRALAREANG